MIMPKKISLLILNPIGGPVRTVEITPARLAVIALLFVALAALLAAVVIDYTRVKRAFPRIQQTRHTLALRSGRIARRQRQFQSLSNDIETLKNKWEGLHHLEGKIKSLAGLDPIATDGTHFGIGGDSADQRDLGYDAPLRAVGR